MVSSPKYEQLMRFATAAEDGLTQLEKHDPLHRQTIEGLTDMIERVKHFREHQGFEGLTGDAIKKWIEASLSRYDAEFTGYVSGFSHYLEARRMLKHAAEDARLLPTALLDSKTAAMRDLAQVVIPVTKYMGLWGFPFNSLATTGEAYVNAVEAQANAAREEQSEKILARITKASSSLASSLHECTEAMRKIPDSKDGMKFPVPPPSPTPVVKVIERGNVPVSDHDPSVYGGDRDTDFGRSGQRDPKSGVYPDGYDEGGRISDRIMSSKRIPNTFVPEGELGSRLNPVTDPNDLMNIDLLHSRVNGDRHANGVIGGHTPASSVLAPSARALWGCAAVCLSTALPREQLEPEWEARALRAQLVLAAHPGAPAWAVSWVPVPARVARAARKTARPVGTGTRRSALRTMRTSCPRAT